jgi:hypothetical protein
MNSADYFGSTLHLLPLALQSNAQYLGLSRYRYQRSLIVSSARPLRQTCISGFCLHCQPNHKMIPLTMQRRRRQAIALARVQHSWDLLRLLHYYHSVDGGFQGAPKLVSGHMHWTKDYHQWRHHQRKDLNNRQVQFATNLTAVLLLCPRSELSQVQRVRAAPLPTDMPLTASALIAHGSSTTSAFFLLQTFVFTT